MKNYLFKRITKLLSLLFFSIYLIPLKGDFLNAEYLTEEFQIDATTKTDNDNLDLPTNPFEIVEKIRRYNSMNEATSPSDAIDDALKAFNDYEE